MYICILYIYSIVYIFIRNKNTIIKQKKNVKCNKLFQKLITIEKKAYINKFIK